MTKEAPDSVVWTKEADRAFIRLRKSLCSRVCLHVPVPGDVFVMYTDASAVAIGGCLHVVRDDGFGGWKKFIGPQPSVEEVLSQANGAGY